MSTPTISAPAVIVPGRLYRLDEFRRITGFGAHAMRTARRAGLRVRYLGGRAFRHSDDFFRYLERLDSREAADERVR